MTRITTLMTAQNTISNLAQAYDRLTKTQDELSSGKKINQPSDDPYGMSVIMKTQGQLGALTTYQGNVDDGESWAQASQGAMSNIANMVQRVRELVVASANGTLTKADMAGDAAEVGQLITAIKQEANTSYNGQFLFSGNANVQPYQSATGDAYQGNANAVTRVIGPGNTTVQVNVDLGSVLGSGVNGPSGPDGIIATLNSVYQHMSAGDSSSLGSVDLGNLDQGFGVLTQQQAVLGATTDRLQMASTRIESLQSADTQVLSATQDADMAQTAINYSTQQAAFSAALKAGANIVQSSLMDFLK